jgi:hypothetical protein
MRKIITFILALVLIASLAVTSFAATPKWEYKPITLPQIKVSIKIPDSVFDNWFKDHPLNLNISFTAPTLS